MGNQSSSAKAKHGKTKAKESEENEAEAEPKIRRDEVGKLKENSKQKRQSKEALQMWTQDSDPRQNGITERRSRPSPGPIYGDPVTEEDIPSIATALGNLTIFAKLPEKSLTQIARAMHVRSAPFGEQLIREGDTGVATDELYVVASGHFEVLESRHGARMLVNQKSPGDVFGELSLLYTTPRSATVQASRDSTVWVLSRTTFKQVIQLQHLVYSEREVFLNSVSILAPLRKEEKLMVAELLREQEFAPGTAVMKQGDRGEVFYIIMEGECSVRVQSTGDDGVTKEKEVNKLFRADFFGERALFTDEPRGATVLVVGDVPLRCLTLSRRSFIEYLGPLQELLEREKSATTMIQRMSELSGTQRERKIKVVLKSVDKRMGKVQTVCRGSALEMLLLTRSDLDGPDVLTITLEVGDILGGGSNGLVRVCTDPSSGRQYALKIMHKVNVMSAAEHVFQEQKVTRLVAHPFCMRQYASFQNAECLYFLFDYMTGGDLMDRLAADAKICSFRKGSLMGKTKRYLQGMHEQSGSFYVASLVLAVDYLHTHNIIYRDLKPENVLLDSAGYIKLVDFGFAKCLQAGERTFTFCGTPGYVAPETILARGYNMGADWWCLGVLTYVLLTGRQPFTAQNVTDPMKVMKRIVDLEFEVSYPPYLSPASIDFMNQLLERRPAQRLGNKANGVDDIKNHPWFAHVDWEKLVARRLVPPRNDLENSALLKIQAQRMQDLESEHSAMPRADLVEADLIEAQNVFASF